LLSDRALVGMSGAKIFNCQIVRVWYIFHFSIHVKHVFLINNFQDSRRTIKLFWTIDLNSFVTPRKFDECTVGHLIHVCKP
jgi:hypothetical protein